MTRFPKLSTSRRERLFVVQVAAAAVDGLALSTVVVHAVVALSLSPAAIGVVMAAGASVALLAAPLAGALMDRLGLHRVAATGSVGTAVALLGYATARSAAVLALSVALFMTAQAWSGAARQGLAVAGVPEKQRLSTRATMHTLLNAGLGAGTMAGAVLIAADVATVRIGYLVAAAVSVGTAAVLRRLPPTAPSPSAEGGVLVALRDRRMAVVTGLAVVVQLSMPILSVLLPVWVVAHTAAPRWTPAAALAVNTVLVIAVQRWWSARLRTDRDAARSAGWAALGLVTMGILLVAATTASSGPAAVGLVIAAVVALTLGEVAGGAAVWHVALGRVPAGAEGRYQATFSMSASAARVLGPLVALPLVVQAPQGGWLGLSVVMAAAILGVAALARRPASPAPADRSVIRAQSTRPLATRRASAVQTGEQ